MLQSFIQFHQLLTIIVCDDVSILFFLRSHAHQFLKKLSTKRRGFIEFRQLNNAKEDFDQKLKKFFFSIYNSTMVSGRTNNSIKNRKEKSIIVSKVVVDRYMHRCYSHGNGTIFFSSSWSHTAIGGCAYEQSVYYKQLQRLYLCAAAATATLLLLLLLLLSMSNFRVIIVCPRNSISIYAKIHQPEWIDDDLCASNCLYR